jgi:hypothetical protein
MKICPVGAQLFHTDRHGDRQTARHCEASGRFSKFCERIQKPCLLPLTILQEVSEFKLFTHELEIIENSAKLLF